MVTALNAVLVPLPVPLLQLLLGFIRPPAGSAAIRALWQVLHALLGRATLLLGVVNVFIGVYLLNTLYKGKPAYEW